MSARSPRSSMSGASSSEVAQDFEDSLKDLAANNKYEIQNLTLIAKESTEHAQAISQVLEKHIKTTRSERKLPALYVLDSIVKNVGTPYTVYLGRNLYSTFMEAYSLVDGGTRKAMEAVLKTWKEPVFGSMDTQPVFSPDLVRPIENALIKAKTIALQRQRQLPQGQYRNTPTPPQANGRYAPPNQMLPPAPGYGYGSQQPTPQPSMPQPFLQPGFQSTPVQQTAQPYAAPPPQPGNDLEAIKQDLLLLIHRTEQELSRDIHNQMLQGKLKALHDLRTILYAHQLGPAQLGMIAEQMRNMSITAPPQPRPTPPVILTPQWQPPVPVPPPQQMAFQPPMPFLQPPSVQTMQPPFQQPPPPLPPAQLGSLAALFSSVPKPSTPQLRAAVPSLQNAPHAQVDAVKSQAATAPSNNGVDLLAALTKAGLMRPAAGAASTSTPAPAPLTSNPAHANLAALLGSLGQNTPQQLGAPPPSLPKPRILLTNKASLETYRPELVHQLYAGRPSQCPQCGRRFAADARGAAAKTVHLDWHFRVNQRVADNSARGHHRSWFVDEREWMALREFDQSTATADAAASQLSQGGAGAGAGAADRRKVKGPEDRWVRAPAGVTRSTCSICYEEMRSSHPEELQDWVFMNAAMNGGKIVHATCLAEMQQGAQNMPLQSTAAGGGGGGGGGGAGGGGGGSSQSASLAAALAALGAAKREGSRTPDSSLGKRKAEDEAAGGGGKILRES